MAYKETQLPRLTQAIDRGHLLATVIKLYGYTVVQQSLVEKNFNPESIISLSIDGELYHVCSPVFKIEDETRVWKLKFEEYNDAKDLAEVENDSASLGDIRIKMRRVDVTGDPNGSQLRQLCQKGIMEDIQCVLKNSRSCNLLLNLCDVPYPRPEDLCDKVFSNLLLKIPGINKVLVVHPKVEAEVCGMESGLEGTWNRYLATDMTCLLWKKEESHFTKFEKKYLKHVVQNGFHDLKTKEESTVKKDPDVEKPDGDLVKKEEIKEDKSLKKEEKLPKKEEKVVKKEDKIVKKEEKMIKKEEKPLRKDLKGLKSEQRSMSMKKERPVKSEVKSVKNEQRSASLKREPKVLKNDQSPKVLKNNQKPKIAQKPAQKPAKKDQKSTVKKQHSLKSEDEPLKNEKDSLKNQKEPLKNGQSGKPIALADLAVPVVKPSSVLLIEVSSHPVFRGFCLAVVLFTFYFLSSEILVALLLIGTSLWFMYGSKKPEFKKYMRSGDPRVLAYRRIYEKEIEKLRYAKDLRRMRDVHKELKECVLNAYAVNRVSTGDIIGVEDHEELERELELTFKEFVTENDVETLLHEAHYTSFALALTVFLYLTSRVVYLGLGKVWRPVRTVAIIVSVILLCFALCVVSNFLSMSVISRRLVGSAEMFCVVFGLWLVTDVTGFLIEIRACIDHVTGVIWREVELEKCIMKSPSHLVVKLALDSAVLLSLFPLAYISSAILSVFSVSSLTMVYVSRYFPPGVFLLRLFTRLAFFGEVLRFANLVMFTSLASKFYGLHNKREDPLDSLLYKRVGYDMGTATEYVWKPVVKYINDLK